MLELLHPKDVAIASTCLAGPMIMEVPVSITAVRPSAAGRLKSPTCVCQCQGNVCERTKMHMHNQHHFLTCSPSSVTSQYSGFTKGT